MRSSDQSPSIVPPGDDQDVYLVLDDFGGRIGQSWRETDVGHTDLETLIEDLLEDQYSNPVRIVAFNTAEGRSRDVSEEVAQILSQRSAEQRRDLVSSVQEFVDRYQNWVVKEMTTAGRPSITKTERRRSANLLQMPRGLMCKL